MIQNMMHLQTSKNPRSKHKMEKTTQKKNLNKNIKKYKVENIICFRISNHQNDLRVHTPNTIYMLKNLMVLYDFKKKTNRHH